MERKYKIIIVACVVIFILYTIFSGHFLQPIYSPAVVLINVGLNEHYHSQLSLIKNEGNRTINNMVDDTIPYGKDPKRLNIFADVIADNFTDIYWPSQQNENFFCYYQNNKGNGEWTWCAPFNGFFGSNPRAYGYIKDKKGRVRSILPNDLTYSPEWIAYQKTGACEALSILFNETANRSGFISRIVCSKNEKVGHFWNEVMINNEWKYFDVQRYGQVKNTDESSFWSGNRSDYGKKSGFSYSELTQDGIFIFDLQTKKCGNQEVTRDYLEQSH